MDGGWSVAAARGIEPRRGYHPASHKTLPHPTHARDYRAPRVVVRKDSSHRAATLRTHWRESRAGCDQFPRAASLAKIKILPLRENASGRIEKTTSHCSILEARRTRSASRAGA